ncbi:hypothetical protein LJR289_002341 [Pseudoduganella sp. LjRoot289]|uniref:hypothetical protein n=1 Tax=Pseudoduganella sp. LjRoot289 TaxID=3342314 RepID=UPI003ED0E54F
MAGAWYELLLALLAVWRVTHLLHREDGPWDVMAHLREWAGEGFLGRMMDCFYCLSLWVALPPSLMLSTGWQHFVLLWPALSAAAIMVERARGALRREED